MRKYFALLVCGLFLNAPSAHSELPPSVRSDLIQAEILESLRAREFASALQKIDELRNLDVPFPTPLLWTEARAAKATNKHVRAEKALEQFLSLANDESSEYSAALQLYPEYEKDATNQRMIEAARLKGDSLNKNLKLVEELSEKKLYWVANRLAEHLLSAAPETWLGRDQLHLLMEKNSQIVDSQSKAIAPMIAERMSFVTIPAGTTVVCDDNDLATTWNKKTRSCECNKYQESVVVPVNELDLAVFRISNGDLKHYVSATGDDILMSRWDTDIRNDPEHLVHDPSIGSRDAHPLVIALPDLPKLPYSGRKKNSRQNGADYLYATFDSWSDKQDQVLIDALGRYLNWLGKYTHAEYRLATKVELAHAMLSGKHGRYPWGNRWPGTKMGSNCPLGDCSRFEDHVMRNGQKFLLDKNGVSGLWDGNIWVRENSLGSMTVDFAGGTWECPSFSPNTNQSVGVRLVRIH